MNRRALQAFVTAFAWVFFLAGLALLLGGCGEAQAHWVCPDVDCFRNTCRIGADGCAEIHDPTAPPRYPNPAHHRMTDEELCRACVCGVTGERCSCNPKHPDQYVDTGWLEQCDFCRLPACNHELGDRCR